MHCDGPKKVFIDVNGAKDFDDEGNLTKDEAATKARRDAINEKRRKLMK